MTLEAALASLREWSPSAESTQLTQRHQRLERFGQFALGGFGVMLLLGFLGLLYTIFTKMVLVGSQPLAGLVLIAFLIFAVLSLAYVVFKENLKEKQRNRPAGRQEAEPSPISAKLIEEREFTPVPTVTENTTDLLPTRERPTDNTSRF